MMVEAKWLCGNCQKLVKFQDAATGICPYCGDKGTWQCRVHVAEGCLSTWDEESWPPSHAYTNTTFDHGDTTYDIDIHVQPIGDMAGTLLLNDEEEL